MFRKIGLIVGCLACGMILLSACSSNALSEAKQTVAQADSVWAEGGMYNDSLSLAQAYETLGHLSPFSFLISHSFERLFHLSPAYVHACYHYGKLLRAKDDPVAAMQVFINATHAGSDDKQILGRIYNNMGDICHRANEFDLSYDMFKHSADVFLSDKDTLSYYYCLNDMAFELAEQGKKEETYTILDNILINCKDRDIYLKTIETRAVACKLVHQYDSTIYYTSLSFKYGCYAKNILLNRAQAYSFLGEKDSAVYYANELVLHTDELFFINSALYILTHEDDNKGIDEIRNISAERSDTQKLIEIRQGKLSQAVQLLEQDINRKPDWRRYVILALLTISVLLFILGVYVWEKRKKQLSSLSQKHATDILESIKKHIDVSDLKTTLHWKDYAAMKSDADLYMGGIVTKLESYHLNEVEIRFCILTLLDFSLKKIAETIHYSYPSAIKTLKKRIANKLSTTPSLLKDFLLHLPPKT